MRIPKKYLKITGIVVFIVLLAIMIGGIIAYNKREALLKVAIAKAILKTKKDYNLNVKIQSAQFDGVKTVVLKNISVVPEKRDTLVSIADLRVSVKLMPILIGRIRLSDVEMHDSRVTLTKHGGLRNYDFLFKKKNKDRAEKKSKIDLSELANKLLNQLLDKIPDDMDVTDFSFSIVHDEDKLSFFVPSATIDGGELNSTILVNKKEATWHINGEVDPGDKQLNIMLYADGKKVELPILEKKYGIKLTADTISTELRKVTRRGGELRMYGSWAVKNLLINHPKIAANDVIVPDGAIDANVFIGENYVSIDSSSVIHLKGIKANPYLKYTLYPNKIYELKLHTDDLGAKELFDAFPVGLFESLDGMKVAGKLQYDLNFYLNTSNLDAVRFDSRLSKKNFKILKWGKTNLQKINRDFIYTPYEYDKPMRDILISPKNPNYTSLNNIAPDLKNALLTAEDPSFFTHRGFVEESIRKAIATNFKERAFKRGGSTISMQLVKNVYLNRQKTLARKIEEMLMVWLIENGHLSTKQRMFEVYLNLIEWGPNIYGIGEASRYYFNKHPSQLTLGESLFLANIVPRPKSGLYFFHPDGSLRPALRGYFKLIGNLMAERGLTYRDSNAYGFYGVMLKESLRRMTPADTTVSDSTLLLDNDFGEHESFLQNIFRDKNRKDTISIDVSGKRKTPANDSLKTIE